MAYRGSAASVVCYRHASAEAAQACVACERPVCEPCVSFEGAMPHCPDCAARVARKRRRRRNLLISGSMILVGVIAGTFIHLGKPYRRDHGKYEARIEALERDLAADHCDEAKQLELIDLLGKARDPNGMTHRWAIFVKHCPWLATKYGFRRPAP